MSDVSRYLPLSQRPRRDESGVTGDWSDRTAAVLTSLAGLVDGLAPDARAAVQDDLARLVWRLRSTRRQRAAAAISRRSPRAMSDDLPGVLRSLTADYPRRRPLGDLAAAVITALDIAEATHTAIDIDPVSLGAVAVARALNAPLPIRAVLRDLTLVAGDGDWSVGRGPESTAAGATIVLFLYGRTGLPASYDGEKGGDRG
ncbi:hypothetical protein [Conyzicola sp.]|uniref:hypothetical protein n=1 Tax=Conyzicola sp. TaxID=1969404 RepID=UPI00398A2AD4